MTQKQRRMAQVLLVLAVASMSCESVDWFMCITSGGRWVERDYLAGRTRDFNSTDSACDDNFDQAAYDAWKNYQTLPGLAQGESDPDGADVASSEDALGAGDHLFSAEDCACAGVAIPLQPDSASASNNAYIMGNVELTGHLTCDWQQLYESENKTGMIRVYLNVSELDVERYAQMLYGELRDEMMGKPQYCEAEPDRCTVTAAEFGDQRAFYSFGNIYVGGRGELPSDHGASLARLILGTSGTYYVIDLLVTHPELQMGDTWVTDTAHAVEQCALGFLSE